MNRPVQHSLRDRIAGSLAQARLAVEAIVDEANSAAARRMLISSLISFGDLVGARELALAHVTQSANAAGEMDYLLADIGRAHAVAGNLAGALQTADAIGFVHIKVSVFEEVARAQAIASDVGGAIQTASRIKVHFQEHETGIAVMTLTNRRIDELQARHQIAEAQALQAAANARAKVAGYLARAGKVAQARELWNEALHMADTIVIPEWAQPIFQQIAQQQIKRGEVAAAIETVGHLPAQMGKIEIYVDAVRVQVEAGDLAAARNTADAIEEQEGKSRAYMLIAKALLRSDVSVGAERMFQEALERAGAQSSRVDACVQIAEARAEVGDLAGASQALDQAREMADGFVTRGFRSSAYLRIGEMMAKIGLRESAHAILALSGQSMARTGVVLAQIAAGDLAGAKLTAGQLKDARECWPAIAIAQAKGGDIDGACTTAGAIVDDMLRLSALKDIAKVVAGAGNVARAKGIVFGMPVQWRSNGLREIAECQAMAGDLAGAILTADEIGEDVCTKSAAYFKIALTMGLAEDFNRATSWAESLLQNPRLRVWVLLGLANGLMSVKS